MTDIAARLRRLEDRAELDDLVVRYFLAADGDDLATIAETFSDTGTFAVSGAVVGSGPQGVVDFIVSQRNNMGLTVHTPNYTLFTFLDADHAEGLVGAHLEMVLHGSSTFGAVRYHDRYERVDGRWVISARNMRTIYFARWDEVAEAFASDTPQRWPGFPPAPTDIPRPIRNTGKKDAR